MRAVVLGISKNVNISFILKPSTFLRRVLFRKIEFYTERPSLNTMPNSKVAIVTGANKGIGYAVVRNLLKQRPDWTVYLTARDHVRGEAAVKKLKDEEGVTARFHQLDVNSIDSICKFRDYLAKEHPQGIHALVNNAGVIAIANIRQASSNDNEFKINRQLRDEIFETNYFGTRNVCTELLPLMAENGRVVIVSSRLSLFTFMNSTEQTQQRVKSCSTVQQVDELMNDFLAADPDKLSENGWASVPPTANYMTGAPFKVGSIYCYGISKIGLNLLTSIYNKSFADQKKNVIVNACCPGRVITDGNPTGTLTLDEGADTLVYLTLLPDNTDIRGQFIFQRNVIEMFPAKIN